MIRCLVQREMMHEKGVYLKPLFKTPCSNCYWGWSKPIMLDYRDISLMECVPLLWRTVTASPVGIEPMTILDGGGPYNWYLIHNVEKSTFSTGWPPNTPYDCAEARRTQVADATFRDLFLFSQNFSSSYRGSFPAGFFIVLTPLEVSFQCDLTRRGLLQSLRSIHRRFFLFHVVSCSLLGQ